MKRHKVFLAVLVSLAAMTSCMDKEWEVPSSLKDNPPYGNNDIQKYRGSRVMTLAELKSQYASVISSNSYKEITEDLQLQVVVNGNDAGGNIYKQISVQDETGGIIVGINGTDMFPYMPVGQALLISLKGLYIGGYGEQAQLGGLHNGSIGRMDVPMWTKHVRLVPNEWVDALVDTVTVDAGADFGRYTGRVVKLEDVTISGEGTQVLAPEDGTVALTSNCANRVINGRSGLVLRTSSYSDFAKRAIPTGKVDLYGVCVKFKDTWQILMRTNSDMVEKQ